MGSNSDIEVYERLPAGLGDMIMLRPAIIGNMQRKPDARHILHAWEPVSHICDDIHGLEIVRFGGEELERFVQSRRLVDSYGGCNLYELSAPGLVYEVENAPYRKDGDVAIPTGRRVLLSRQEIFCGVVGVGFSIDNYQVSFSGEERSFADGFLSGIGKAIGVQLRSAQSYRDYRYMQYLLEYVASRCGCWVVTFDQEYKYGGKLTNIRSLVNDNIRNVWCVASRMVCVIAPDSFLVHAAGSAGVFVYGLYGPTDPMCRIKYPLAVCSPEYSCSRPRCWYNPCKQVYCLNTRTPAFYWKDLLSQYKGSDFGRNIGLVVRKQGELAVVLLEGLGGTVTLSDHAKKVCEEYGVKPYVVVRGYEDLFESNPYISGVVSVGSVRYEDCEEELKSRFGSVAIVKTGVGQWFGKISNANNKRWRSVYESMPAATQQLKFYGLNMTQMANYTLGLRHDEIDVKVYAYGSIDFDLPEEYIVVSNGVDIWHKGLKQTKSWEHGYWERFVGMLGVPVVQVGTNYDKPIKGAIDLRSKTTVLQLLTVLKGAHSVFCTEGGIMHLSYAVGHLNVFVIRGPTSGVFYSYPGHHLIDSYVCGECFWLTEDWYKDCPKGVNAICMKSISPERVENVFRSHFEYMASLCMVSSV